MDLVNSSFHSFPAPLVYAPLIRHCQSFLATQSREGTGFRPLSPTVASPVPNYFSANLQDFGRPSLADL